jgi:hypothetical protein
MFPGPLWFVLPVLLVGAPARAQTVLREEKMPELATLDRVSDRSGVTLSSGVMLLDGNQVADLSDLHVRYVLDSGVGAYAAVPFGTIPEAGNTRAYGVGNLELGGSYALNRGGENVLLFRAGALVPTANSRFLTAIDGLSAMARFTDRVLLTDMLCARFSLSPLGRVARFLYRADFGADVPLERDGQVLGRINLAVGVDLGPVSLLGELATIAPFSAIDREHTLATAAFTANLEVWPVKPYAGVIVPLNERVRERARGALMIGLNVPLPE